MNNNGQGTFQLWWRHVSQGSVDVLQDGYFDERDDQA